MSAEGPDVIVIGAGMAGICCAGELVLEGARPLLICEGREVGAAVRSKMVDGNRGIMQTPTWQIGWGGGWWPTLVRRLNAPVFAPLGFGPLDYGVGLHGVEEKPAFPQCGLSGEGLAGAVLEIFPQFGGLRPELARVLADGLAIPYQELAGMHRVRLMDWLGERKADEAVTQVMLALASALTASSTAFCVEHVSVYATLGYLRSFFCGEATYGIPFPDIREGLLIPLAKAIEARGGTVWRGRKVARVNVEGERVGSVVMEDGTEVRAPMVAIATGNSRIPALLDPLPPEIVEPLGYTDGLEHRNFNVFTVLEKPIVPADANPWVGVLDPETGSLLHWLHNVHKGAPWTTAPGKQFITSGLVLRPDEVTAFGGDGAVFDRLHGLLEDCYPGYKDASGASENLTHGVGHLWFGNCTVGPKLSRTIDSVEGLWFVGEGSEPTVGTYMEAATSAGILGARQMAAARRSEVRR